MCIDAGLRIEDRGSSRKRCEVFSRSSITDHRSCQRGVGLIELILFILVISIALAGILLAMNQVTAHGADTLPRKQALTAADTLLEEIESQNFSGGACTGTLGPNAARSGATKVCDYNGYSTTAGILDFSTNMPVAGLSNFNVSVAVTNSAFGGIPAASAVMITVAVTDPAGQKTEATGYRTAY